jgi:hypothetical protein
MVLSFGALQSAAQTRIEIDSIKTFHAQFLNDALKKDPMLKIDTIWVKYLFEVEGWGSFGSWESSKRTLTIKFLATKLEKQELNDKINIANLVVPIAYSHESNHRDKDYLWSEPKSIAWTAADYMQQYISNELSARLAETFYMRWKILDGDISKSLLHHIINGLPKSKAYLKDYYSYLVYNTISEKISQTEADLMLTAVAKWMTEHPRGKDDYYGEAAVMSYYYADKNIGKLYGKKLSQDQTMDFDNFMLLLFLQQRNDKPIDIFSLVSESAREKFLTAIAEVMKKYEKDIIETDKKIKTGWSGTIQKITKKHSGSAKIHDAATLRAAPLYLKMT